jgi:hypothetical protein
MGNIGSEIGRAISWSQRGNREQSERALDRGLELFDLTLGDARWHGRSKEIARAREVVCDYFYGNNSYGSTPATLENYFLHFGAAARREAEIQIMWRPL